MVGWSWRSILATSLLILSFAAVTHGQAAQVTAIRAGRLFDSKSGQMLTRQVVLVEGERITGVGPEDQIKIPAGARVLDLSQATVLPGLIDGHIHIFDSLSTAARVTTTNEAWALLALKESQTDMLAGFTSMRDCGTHGEGYGDVDVRNAINSGLFDGPRLQVSTRGISGAGTNFIGIPGSTIPAIGESISGPEQARAVVREQIHYGADWIKVFPSGGWSFSPTGELSFDSNLTLEELQAIVDEAHRHNRRVAAHAFGGAALRDSILAGVDTIEHGQGLNEELVKMMIQKGIYYDPTGIRYTLPEIAEQDRRNTGGKYSIIPIFEKNAQMAIGSGVKIVFGSGAEGGPYPHGTQSKDLIWLTQHGMATTAALQSATWVNAQMMAWEDRIGSIEKGKYADIVAVSGNPVQDITEMQRVKFVMKGGKVMKNELSGGAMISSR